MSPSSSTRPAADALTETATSTLTLIRRFIAALTDDSRPSALPSNPPEPLQVLHTSATLLKAHTTKLSLLLINKPFTPSAIRSVISDAAGTCIPAMMSAVEICGAEIGSHGDVMYNEVRARVRRVFREMESLLDEVLTLVSSESGSQDVTTPSSKRDSLASTGVVWEACDALIELQSMGLAGLVVKKALSYREMLEDAIAELKEWAEDETSDDEEEQEDGFEASDEENDFDELLGPGSQKRLPKSRDDLKATLTISFKRLRLTSTLYQAVVKRRLKTFPMLSQANTAHIRSIDRVINRLKDIQEHADELAGAFYALDNETAKLELGIICRSGREVTKLTRKNWQDDDDEYTTWSYKWEEAINCD